MAGVIFCFGFAEFFDHPGSSGPQNGLSSTVPSQSCLLSLHGKRRSLLLQTRAAQCLT